MRLESQNVSGKSGKGMFLGRTRGLIFSSIKSKEGALSMEEVACR